MRDFVERFGNVLTSQTVVPKHRSVPAAIPQITASDPAIETMLRSQVAELSQKLGRATAVIAEMRKHFEPEFRSMEKLFGDLDSLGASGQADISAWQPWISKVGGRVGRMIQVLAERGELTRIQLATLTEQSPNSGSFSNNLSTLNRNGLIEKQGDKMRLRPL